MAQIVTITNPLTGQPAQVDQLDHTAQQIDDGIDAAGSESINYPGCYYRMVGGVVEWFNPPMDIGHEYRTTERWGGSPVYAQLFNCSPLPNATTKAFPVEGNYGGNVQTVVDYGGMSMLYGQSLQNKGFASLNVTAGKIYITTETDLSAGDAYVWVKYTKYPG